MNEILKYGDIRLVDAEGAAAVADEVITGDVYRIGTIPEYCAVIDVGSFYGEFAIACGMRGLRVFAFEPATQNFLNLLCNMIMNPTAKIAPFNLAVGERNGISTFAFNDKHPAGSKISDAGHCVWTTTMQNIIAAVPHACAVKLDCEGSEKEIFTDTKWLGEVNWLAMEWHNCDGDYYRDILEACGFFVEMSCEGGNSGGIIHARRKS